MPSEILIIFWVLEVRLREFAMETFEMIASVIAPEPLARLVSFILCTVVYCLFIKYSIHPITIVPRGLRQALMQALPLRWPSGRSGSEIYAPSCFLYTT